MTAPHARSIFPASLPLIVLALLPCLLLWRVVFLHEVFLPADLLRDIAPWRQPASPAPIAWVPLQWDGIAEFYPWRMFAAQTLHQGYLPLWNPHQFCGTPFVGNSQSAVFYPLNFLFVLLPVTTAFGVSALLHLILTGLLMYGFLRSLGMGRSAAMVGAVAWQLSAWQTAWLALPTFLCVSAWLPLALWLTDRLAAHPTAARGAALGACLGVMLLGGHLQIALYCLLLVIAYGIFRAFSQRYEQSRDWAAIVGAGLLALSLMAAIAAPQVLPTLELSHVSHRAGAPLTWMSYQGYIALAMPAINLVTLWLPGFFGNPTQGTYWGIGTNGGPSAYMENASYMGILGLLLAICAVAATWRTRQETRFFTIAAGVALLMALGTPLDAVLFFGLPGFAQSGSPGRILVIWTFCGSVLAAVGTHELSQHRERLGQTLRRAVGAFSVLFALALATTLIWILRNAPDRVLQTNLGREGDLWRLPTGILLGAAALLMLRARGTVSPRRFQGSLVGLVAVDLLAANIGFNHTVTRAAVYPQTPLIVYLQQHEKDGRVMPLNSRWSLTEPPPAVLPPNAATVYGLSDTQGYDSLLTRQYIKWAAALDAGPPAPPENGNMVFTYNPLAPQAQEAGVRYVVSLDPQLRVSNLRPIIQDGETYLYEKTETLPRVRTISGGAAVSVEDIVPTRLRITAAAGAGGVIVADQWYPGWQAWVNGRKTTIEERPDIFRSVYWLFDSAQEKRGQVTVTMRYLPTSFRLGLYGLCAALGLLGAVGGHAALTWGLRPPPARPVTGRNRQQA